MLFYVQWIIFVRLFVAESWKLGNYLDHKYMLIHVIFLYIQLKTIKILDVKIISEDTEKLL